MIGGLAKTLVGFLAGIIGTQFIVAQPLPRFCVFFGATVLHALVFMGLYVVLDLRHFGSPYAAVARAGARRNAAVGSWRSSWLELLPGSGGTPTDGENPAPPVDNRGVEALIGRARRSPHVTVRLTVLQY